MKLTGSRRAAAQQLLFSVAAFIFFQSAFAIDFDIATVRFNQKMPLPNSNLYESMAYPDEALNRLRNDVKVINFMPRTFTIKIAGHTDGHECNGHECVDLSLKHAQLVYDWLVANGVPRERFLPPEGRGSTRLVDDDSSPSGQATNRYIEFVLFEDPLPP